MLSCVKGWFGKTHGEKNETVSKKLGYPRENINDPGLKERSVKDNLCLFDVGPQRKDRLDDQLLQCIGVVLNDLADAPDVKAGANLMGNIFQMTRSDIHNVKIEIGDRYAELFSTGRSRDSASDDGVTQNPARLDQHRVRTSRSTFGFPSIEFPSPANNGNSRPFNACEMWRTFDEEDDLERGGLFSSSRGACVQKAPEEEAYWIASNVCQEAFRKVEIAWNEVEWLAQQVDVVHGAADRMKASLRGELRRQEEKVEKVDGDVQGLSGEVEELTRGFVDEHVASSESKEGALVSFLNTLNGEDGVGDRKVRARARAIALHKAASSYYWHESAGRLFTSHAVKISEVLCDQLFGDLLDILSDMQLRASKRRLICQSDLKSTVKNIMDKLKAAIGSLVHTKHTVAKKREERIHSAMENRMLFGNATANGAADQLYACPGVSLSLSGEPVARMWWIQTTKHPPNLTDVVYPLSSSTIEHNSLR